MWQSGEEQHALAYLLLPFVGLFISVGVCAWKLGMSQSGQPPGPTQMRDQDRATSSKIPSPDKQLFHWSLAKMNLNVVPSLGNRMPETFRRLSRGRHNTVVSERMKGASGTRVGQMASALGEIRYAYVLVEHHNKSDAVMQARQSVPRLEARELVISE